MNERYTMLAALKGTALKCLFVFFWEHRQITVTDLAMYVGHDDQTVRTAMRQLELYGLAAPVISSQETWHLTDCGYQLPLPFDQIGTHENKPHADGTIQEKFSLSPVTTTTILTSSDQLSSSSSSMQRGEKFSSPSDGPGSDTRIAANLTALHQAGIRGKKADTLARLEWVTPEYIEAHVEKVKEEFQRLGLAICRMESGDPIPERPQTLANRYIGGKYGEFIEH